MLAPLSWLRDFAPFDVAPSDRAAVVELGRVMDDLGLVVEGVTWVGEGLEEVVVARVAEIAPIAGADRVRRVVVDAGGDPVEVVCGAWNFAVDDLVPLAPVGAVLPGGFAIGRRRMRGVTSNGMLCSGRELGLSEDAGGLLVLGNGSLQGGAGGDKLAPGTPLTEALGIEIDAVYDLAIETNRPDALCMAGVARDVAARLGLSFSLPEPTAEPRGASGAVPQGASGAGGGSEVGEMASARVEAEAEDLCPRLVVRVLTDVRVGPSPAWVARRLTLAGMRPINSVVDASNYVMLELGQPTHPYDLDRLGGRGLLVRRARPGETLVTLDGVERVLGRDGRTGAPVDDCLICDATGAAVGIAGVMGGASSEISPSTARVLLEAAWFRPMAIARTSRRLGLRTEASARFERGCDPEGIDRAVARFCELVTAAGGGARVVPGVLDRRGPVPSRPRVRLRTARVNAILGTSLSDAAIAEHLAPLGFAVTQLEPGEAEVEVPTWRPDSEREIDVIEEVARHHGYSAIPRTRPVSPRVGRISPYQRDRRRVRAAMCALGASEAWTSSLLAPEDHPSMGLEGPGIEVENPLAREESVLRRSLLPGLLRALSGNAAHRDGEIRLFEVGHVFDWAIPSAGSPVPLGVTTGAGSQGLVEEREMAALALAQAADDAAAAVVAWRWLVETLALGPVDIVARPVPGLHASRSAVLVLPDGGPELGCLGEVGPQVLEAFGLGGRRVGWVEVDLGRLADAPRRSEEAKPVSRFPSADIDLAFVVDDRTPAAAVAATLTEAGGDLLARVNLFDVYRDEHLGRGVRSLAHRLRFEALDRTLTDDELGRLRGRCIQAVEAAHPAHLRT